MDTHTYKVHLEELLATITAELKTVGIHNPENPSDWVAVPEELDAEEPDQNLSADAVEEWNERNALVATLEKEYNDIREALARLEAHTYGSCEICNHPIEERRLVACPTARTCVAHREDEGLLA